MEWWKTAVNGDKIVCINDAWHYEEVSPLQLNCIYTVEEIWVCTEGCIDANGDIQNEIALVNLLEVIHPRFDNVGDGFDVRRFRPVEKAYNKAVRGVQQIKQILNVEPIQDIERVKEFC